MSNIKILVDGIFGTTSTLRSIILSLHVATPMVKIFIYMMAIVGHKIGAQATVVIYSHSLLYAS